MIVILQTSKAEWDEKEKIRKVTLGELPVEIDTSFRAHLKWEEQFQPTLKCSLSDYTDRVKGWGKDEKIAMANSLGVLKLLYCYINSDKLPTFKDFLGLFEPETFKENFKRIQDVLDQVGKSAAKN